MNIDPRYNFLNIVLNKYNTLPQSIKWLVTTVWVAAISAVVSAYVNQYYEARRQSIADKINTIVQIEQQISGNHEAVLAAASTISWKILDEKKLNEDDSLELNRQAVKSQASVSKMAIFLDEKGKKAAEIYGQILNQLRDALDQAKSREELKPVYSAVQKLLGAYDDLLQSVQQQKQSAIAKP